LSFQCLLCKLLFNTAKTNYKPITTNNLSIPIATPEQESTPSFT